MYSKMIISLLLLSHIVNDFYIQNDKIANEKKYSLKILGKHSIGFLFCALALTIPFLSSQMISLIIYITVIHFIIDKLKILCEANYKRVPIIFFFIADQILHVIVILSFYPFTEAISLNTIGQSVNSWLIKAYPLLNGFGYNSYIYIILFISLILFIANAGTLITLLCLNLPSELAQAGPISNNQVQTNQDQAPTAQPSRRTAQETAATLQTVDMSNGGQNVNNQSNISQPIISSKQSGSNSSAKGYKKYGKVIGILERIIILLLILSNHYEGIAFVITAKSIARFKQFQDDDFSDYYLVGTLSSSLVAIVSGITFQIMCKILEL